MIHILHIYSEVVVIHILHIYSEVVVIRVLNIYSRSGRDRYLTYLL